MKIRFTPFALTALLAFAAGPAAAGDGPDHKDLVSPFGAKGHHRDGGSKITGRDHADHLIGKRHQTDGVKRDLIHEHRKGARGKPSHVHRDHLVRKKLGRDYHRDRYHRHRHDRLKSRVFGYDRYGRYDRYRDWRYDRRHPKGCGCSVCVKTTKIVITPRPKVYERRTVIRRPVIEREVVYTPRESAWSLLADWRFQRALEAFGDRASRDRRSGEHKVGYALAAYGLGETKLAATAFRRALELDPQVMTAFVPSRRLERLVLELEGRLDRAVRHDPYDTDAVFTLSSVRTLLGHVRSGSDLDHEDLAMLRDTDRELLERALGAEEDDPYRE